MPVIQDEMRRKLRAVGQVISSVTKASAKDLHESLFQVRHALDLGQPVIGTVDLMTRPGSREPAAVRALRLDFALDTHLAWRMVTGFRKAWSLQTREPD